MGSQVFKASSGDSENSDHPAYTQVQVRPQSRRTTFSRLRKKKRGGTSNDETKYLNSNNRHTNKELQQGYHLRIFIVSENRICENSFHGLVSNIGKTVKKQLGFEIMFH